MTKRSFDSSRQSIFQNFSWIVAGYAVYNLCQWANLALIAKLLSANAVGQFTLSFAIAGPVFIFTNLGLRQALAADSKNKYSLGEYFLVRGLATVLALMAILLMPLGFDHEQELASVIAIVAIAKAVEAQSDLFYGLFQRSERSVHIAVSLLLRGVVGLAALSSGFYFFQNLSIGLAGVLLVWLITLICYDLPCALRLLRRTGAGKAASLGLARFEFRDVLRATEKFGRLSTLIWEVLPLGFVGILSTLQMTIPRYFVAEEIGLRELGYFGAILYIVLAGNNFVQALAHSAVYRLSLYYANADKKRYLRLLTYVTLTSLAGGAMGLVVAVFWGDGMLTLIYTGEYGRHNDIFIVLMAAGAIRYAATMLNYGATAARKFRLQMVNHSVTTIVVAATCVLLVPRYGLMGAAFAVLVAAMFYLAGALLMIRHAICRIGED